MKSELIYKVLILGLLGCLAIGAAKADSTGLLKDDDGALEKYSSGAGQIIKIDEDSDYSEDIEEDEVDMEEVGEIEIGKGFHRKHGHHHKGHSQNHKGHGHHHGRHHKGHGHHKDHHHGGHQSHDHQGRHEYHIYVHHVYDKN
ncbi:MAG: hypothetical protein LBI29_00785 [Rickettsiales bacterium]|jgi:hypothetical protein|nr:hypothetical protein [Rickettsiales bacterium]